MFSIKENPFGLYTEYQLFNSSTNEFVSIIPAFGATLNQVALQKNGKVHELMEGCKTYEELITEGRSKFKGSKLFPFPNRIADGAYEFEKRVYNFPINFPHEKNAIHGILLESNFEIIKKETSSEGAGLEVRHSTIGNEQGYPFQVEITIYFLLNREGFSCTTQIKNKNRTNVPVGDGWHPYFKTGSKVDDCILYLPVQRSFEVDHRMIPTGKTTEGSMFTKPTQISGHSFDTGYQIIDSSEKRVATLLYDPIQEITLHIWQEVGNGKYNFVQVYTPPDRKSIAIEPMSCLADAFNNKIGEIVLKEDETLSLAFGLKLE